MANNPFYVDPTGGVDTSSAYQNLISGMGQLGQKLQQDRQANASAARNKEATQAVSSAIQSGDPTKIAQTMLQYPEMANITDKVMNYKRAATKENMKTSMQDILSNPDNIDQTFQNRIALIKKEGGDPSDTEKAYEEYKEDPAGFLKNTENAYAVHFPKEALAYQQAKAAGEPKQMTPYQKAQINLQKQDQDIQKQQLDIQRQKAKYAQEENETKRKQMSVQLEQQQQKLEASKQKQQQTKQQAASMKQTSLDLTGEAYKLANDIASSDDLSDITGTVKSRLFTFRDSSQDLINKAQRLDSLLTKDNLKLMSGVLTDRDIEFLGRISSGMGITDSGIKGSYGATKQRLTEIAGKLREKLTGNGYSFDENGNMSVPSANQTQSGQQQSGQQPQPSGQQGSQQTVDWSNLKNER